MEEINISKNTHITVIGNSNELIINSLLEYKKISILSYRDILNLSSYKIKEKIMHLIDRNPDILVLNNVLYELNRSDLVYIIRELEGYKKKDGIIVNITNNIEEALFSNRVIIIHNNSIICDDETMNVLSEEKLLKRLGIGMPFIVELNKYFMDYEMIDKYYLSNTKLVGALWK